MEELSLVCEEVQSHKTPMMRKLANVDMLKKCKMVTRKSFLAGGYNCRNNIVIKLIDATTIIILTTNILSDSIFLTLGFLSY